MSTGEAFLGVPKVGMVSPKQEADIFTIGAGLMANDIT
jgi:hypothetical protein